MAYNNFIPEIWSRQVLTDRDKVTVAYQNSTKQWEGEIKGPGSKVRIMGIGGATVNDYYKFGDDRHQDLNLEVLTDESTMLEITEQKSISFMVDDIDKLQSNADVMAPIMKKTANNMAVAMDKFIYSKATDSGTIITQTGVTHTNIFSYLTKAIASVMKAGDIADVSELTLELDPWILRLITLADIAFGNTNNGTISNGYQGTILGVKTFVTNNLIIGTPNANEYFGLLRTNQAIAAAEQLSKMTPGDVGVKGFGEYVKGLHLYGAKMIKPKESCLLDFTIADETLI